MGIWGYLALGETAVVPIMVLAERDIGSRIASLGVDPRVWHWIAAPLAVLSFWSAIALPVLYLPLLVAGIDTTQELLLFLGLFALHVLALVGGRSWYPSA